MDLEWTSFVNISYKLPTITQYNDTQVENNSEKLYFPRYHVRRESFLSKSLLVTQ